MNKLSSISESSHLGAFHLTKRTSFSCTHSTAFARLHWKLKAPCCHLSFQYDHERIGVLSQRKDHLCHALPLPAVTTGNGSEGSASLSSTSEHEVKVGADRTKYADLLIRFQQGFKMLNKVYQATMRSKWTLYGVNAWNKMPPWIQLPIAIFLPWFLFVSAFYGPTVSVDLLPLWIIGPSMVGFLLKASTKMAAACRRWIAEKKVKETALYVIKEARTGRWLEVASKKVMEARLQMTDKTLEFVVFIRSGRFKLVLRQYCVRKLIEWRETWVERFEDWRLVYLRWERFLKNIV